VIDNIVSAGDAVGLHPVASLVHGRHIVGDEEARRRHRPRDSAGACITVAICDLWSNFNHSTSGATRSDLRSPGRDGLHASCAASSFGFGRVRDLWVGIRPRLLFDDRRRTDPPGWWNGPHIQSVAGFSLHLRFVADFLGSACFERMSVVEWCCPLWRIRPALPWSGLPVGSRSWLQWRRGICQHRLRMAAPHQRRSRGVGAIS